MSRYIDAEWLLNFFEPYPDDYHTPLGTLRACVDDAPSIDIEPKPTDEPQTNADNAFQNVESVGCDRYVITNDEGERAYNCIGCERTDCSWK